MAQITVTPINFSTVHNYFGNTIKNDVGVMDVSSGTWFNFGNEANDIWIYHGSEISFQKLVEKIGYSGMDDEFFFVWLNCVGGE